MEKLIPGLRLVVALGVSLGAMPVAADGQRVGTTALSRNEVSGVLGAQRRQLKTGDGIFQNEAITTGRNSQAQMLFLDETALTIGADSRIVLDKAVYDPQKRSGEITLRAVSGAFRFVSGSSASESYKIATPMGTIGVRGTIMEFTIKQDLLTLILHQGAAIYCARPSQCTTLNQPGTFIVSDGTRSSRPQRLSSVGCGTGNCSEVDPNRPSLGSLINAAPGAGPPPSPAVTPNFRNLRQQRQGNR